MFLILVCFVIAVGLIAGRLWFYSSGSIYISADNKNGIDSVVIADLVLSLIAVGGSFWYLLNAGYEPNWVFGIPIDIGFFWTLPAGASFIGRCMATENPPELEVPGLPPKHLRLR